MPSILHFPPMIQFFLIFVVFGLVGALGPGIARRSSKGLAAKDHHDVLGMMFSGAAAFYGVVLAFVIVAAWQNFQDAAQREQTELLALTELYEVGTRMPPPTSQLMTTAIRGYVSDSLVYEWSGSGQPQFMKGRGNLRKMLAALLSLNPQTNKDGILYGKAMDEITRLFEARQQRMLYSQSNIPTIVWVVIIFGAAVTIALSFFFFTAASPAPGDDFDAVRDADRADHYRDRRPLASLSGLFAGPSDRLQGFAGRDRFPSLRDGSGRGC